MSGTQAKRLPNVSLDGLTLHVEDVERSREFYARLPGAALIAHRRGDFALFRIGNGRLGLLRRSLLDPAAVAAAYGEEVSQAIPAFHVEIESPDLEATYAGLVEAGVPTQGPPRRRPWGETDFVIQDPDGNRLEFGAAHSER
jgi:catechol 2,3-dioxygenase-like lactoylglutathione lyase family enzyme